MREISGGSGYCSQNSLPAEFGLGVTSVADSVIVHWPSGTIQDSLAVGTNQQIVMIEPLGVGIDDSPAPLPTAYRLHANIPNPFNPVTTIRYELPAASRVSLWIYDAAGRVVRPLEESVLREAGRHEVTWDGRNHLGDPVASGIYFYRIEAGDFRAVRRMVLLR
jgi:hypothetical protein